MARSMSRGKATRLPKPTIDDATSKKSILPFNGHALHERGFSFSFSCFDCGHELFNLGGTADDGTVGGRWFIDLLNCFKSVNNMTIQEVKESIHDLHPVDWSHANTRCPSDSQQHEYWQFRLNKGNGRVIGILIDGVFYVVWLDRHHNLTDSEGYGGAQYFRAGQSEFNALENENRELKQEINNQQHLIDELFDELMKQC